MRMSAQPGSPRPLGGRSATPSRRRFLRAGLLAGASLLAAACGGQAPAPTAAPPTPAPAAPATPAPTAASAAPTTAAAAPTAAPKAAAAAGKTTYWNYMVDRQEQENKAIAAFRDAHPKIQVVEEYIPWDQYWQKLNATLASSGAPDVWNTAPTFYYEYIKRNQLVDLRDRIKSDLKASDFYTETLPLWEFPRGSGKTYGIPRDFGVGLLFYNKDLLDKAGVAMPTNDWTYEDMLKAALKVNHPSDDPKQAVFGTLASGGRVFLDALIHANGGEVLNETQTKSLYDQPAAVESIKWMVDLVRSHKVAPLPQFFEGLGSPFGTGRVAMAIDGTWAVQGNRKVTAFKFDAVLQPKGKVKRATIGEPDGFVLSQQTKDPDSAWELAK